MTTSRAYYTEAYRSTFQARVMEVEMGPDGEPAVILDQTCFYPTSGGQPHDLGVLAGRPVRDVTIRPEDQAIRHYLVGGPPPAAGQTVTGEIDWPRRFDHMQHHTGQHILSRAFIDTCSAETVSFHLGRAACTIDLDVKALPAAAIQAAETLANRLIWENRPVLVRFVSHEEAAQLPLRKRPPVDAEQLRLIDVQDFDLNACGGTHVARTGEIGQIKITRIERRNDKLRVEFLCGGRALADYGARIVVLDGLIGELTTAPDALLGSVQKLKEENKELQKELRESRGRLLGYAAGELLPLLEPAAGGLLLTHVLPIGRWSLGEARELASALLDRTVGEAAVLFGLPGADGGLVFARSPGGPGHMGHLLRQVLDMLDGGRGGGGPAFAQAGGVAADPEQLAAALAAARERLEKEESGG